MSSGFSDGILYHDGRVKVVIYIITFNLKVKGKGGKVN